MRANHPKVYLVAGGTGGHINAALAIGNYLRGQKFSVSYLTGKRHLDYKLFANQNVLHLNSRPFGSKNPITLLKNVILNLIVFFKTLILFGSRLRDRLSN